MALAAASNKLRIAQASARTQHGAISVPLTFAVPRRAQATAARPLEQPLRAEKTSPAAPTRYVSDADGDAEMAAFQKAQETAARPSAAEEARTMVDQSRHAVLATLSAAADTAGFPSSSVVEFACDGSGRPFFAMSGLSQHTKDLAKDPRVSLTVTTPSFHSMDCGRMTLQGTVAPVAEADKARLREIFLKKYPSAFYVDFGDFQWWRVDTVSAVRFNGGFGRVLKMTVDEYLAAKPDPVYAFSPPVCGHMNADHREDSLAMIKHFCGLTVDGVKMLDLDRLGINCSVERGGQTFKLRLPFPSPAEDRKGIKDQIVDMTKKAKGAAAAAARMAGGASASARE